MIWVLAISCFVSATVGFFMGSLLKGHAEFDRREELWSQVYRAHQALADLDHRALIEHLEEEANLIS